MKKHLLLLALGSFVLFTATAQGNSQKNKNKDKSKTSQSDVAKTRDKKHDDVIWEGTKDKDGGGPKPSKNQPAKVRAAFQKDYPNATNVRWSKYRGDWTATFGNGVFTSTAVYHANGDRRDTRTPIQRTQLPKVLDDIFKKRPELQLGNIIKIEVPQAVQDIFRIKTIADGVSKFLFYNGNGQEVEYDY